MPKRIRLSRKKGFRLPPNAMSVARPTRWGNPFTVQDCREAGDQSTDREIAALCVGAFRAWLTSDHWRFNWDGEQSEQARAAILENLSLLRGKDLACWCALDAPCHADVLLEVANG